MSFVGLNVDLEPVDAQECVGCEKGYSLVAVHERVIHQQRLEPCGRHCDEIVAEGLGLPSPDTGKRLALGL